MKSDDTLVLNADCIPTSMLPLSTMTWHDSIKAQFLDKVSVISTYKDWEVHSPSITMKVPSIIMMKDYVHINRSVKFCEENVLLRDEYSCQYCGLNCEHDHSMLTYDHVIPSSQGGKTNWNNIVMACRPCNSKKSHFTIMKPKIKPAKPKYYDLVGKRKKFPIYIPNEDWIPYLDWPEDKIILTNKRKNDHS